MMGRRCGRMAVLTGVVLLSVLCGRLGGPDPLDYISMYRHDGRAETGVPPHWHYVR